MKWDETVASECRYGWIAGGIWGDWEILWEKSEHDYSGEASFLAKKNGKYCFYEWTYGSCYGCDGWENAGLTDEQIEKEMKNEAMWLDGKKHLDGWRKMLENCDDPWDREKYRTRINAIRKELGMSALYVVEE